MARRAQGRVFSSGEARTLYVSIPSRVATDSAFPFSDGETVCVSIEDGMVCIAPTDDEAESEGDPDREPPVGLTE